MDARQITYMHSGVRRTVLALLDLAGFCEQHGREAVSRQQFRPVMQLIGESYDAVLGAYRNPQTQPHLLAYSADAVDRFDMLASIAMVSANDGDNTIEARIHAAAANDERNVIAADWLAVLEMPAIVADLRRWLQSIDSTDVAALLSEADTDAPTDWLSPKQWRGLLKSMGHEISERSWPSWKSRMGGEDHSISGDKLVRFRVSTLNKLGIKLQPTRN